MQRLIQWLVVSSLWSLITNFTPCELAEMMLFPPITAGVGLLSRDRVNRFLIAILLSLANVASADTLGKTQPNPANTCRDSNFEQH